MPSAQTTDFGPTTQPPKSPVTRDALTPGTRLRGYQIIEVLGRGGFGIVYLALDSSLQRQVAIKEYLPADLAIRCEDQQVWVKPGAEPAAYAAGMAEFLNEAKLLARFDHPSLARVHNFWEDNRTAYMVMPYYDGLTLAATLKGMQRPPDEAWLRALLTPLLGALNTLHNALCYHRDISPDNIILLADGRPVLLDFGVANRGGGDKTMSLNVLLNPAYAPIEQYSESISLPQGPWTDLYALAGVLHFAITGQAPARATVRAIEDPQRPLAETVLPLYEKYPGLHYSPGFLAGIDKALSVKPRDRPRNVADFQQWLGLTPPAAASIPIPPIPERPPETVPHLDIGGPRIDIDIGASNGRSDPTFELPRERHEWSAADVSRTTPPPSKRGSLWAAGVCTVALATVGAWWWSQNMQPPRAQITVNDLPSRVIAAIPSASAPSSLPAANAVPAPAPAVPSATADTASAAAPQIPASEDVATAEAAAPAPSAQVPAEPARQTATAPVQPPPQAQAPAQAQVQAPPRAQAQQQAPARAQTPVQVAAAKTPVATVTADRQRAAAARAPAQQAAAAPRKSTPAETAAAAEPNTPREMCGSRTNFALNYCLQTQCKRPRFTQHAQCIDLRRRGEIS